MAVGNIPVAAIGASAGGLEALQKLVQAIPAQSGICYVIVQHLSPDHPSIMDQLLGAHSTVPVKKIVNGMRAEIDTVYVIPAGPHLTFRNGFFHLHDDRPEKGIRTPIDRFFTSIAEELGRDAFCIILSGTGSDGTAGLKAIKSAGGVAIVQQSSSARFPGMPDSAVATGLVDFTMMPERIPARLIDMVDHRARLNDQGLRERLAKEVEERLPEITDLLNHEGGHDFADYKSGTLVRRIERRMTLLRQRTVDGLIGILKDDPAERERLLQDFLIGVTQFFRDKEAFAALNDKIIRPIIESDTDKVRVWVPGCSTGEEAYSLAILFAEALENVGSRASLQVFGTDIDAAALLHARQGLYSDAAMSEMSEERLQKFFIAEEGGYRAAPVLRECCVFAPHNLLQDPPFSRLDLVSCRNLLIYLNATAQKEVLPRFHYALKPGGGMFLGPSESLGAHGELFTVIDKASRLFKRNDGEAHRYSTLGFSRERGKVRAIEQKRPPQSFRPADPALDVSLETKAEAQFLARFAAPFAVVNAQGEILYLSEQMVRFVKPTKGRPSAELDTFLARDLRLPVRTVIGQTLESGQQSEARDILINDDGESSIVDVVASPMEDAEMVMVVLNYLRQPEPDVLKAAAEGQNYPGREAVEHQLTATRRQLESTQREYESSTQELRSTNEELLSMNEEMQSTNEELETSREELQSINEELETMNAELNENNEQLRRANSDIKNLFESTDIATLFLDSQMCVRGFTPKTGELFGIRDRDAGRPVGDLAQRFSYDNLLGDIQSVGKSLKPIEREVLVEKTNHTYILRIRPYRTIDDRIDGYILGFFDITQRKLNEATLARNASVLAQQYAELETLYDTTPVGLALLKPTGDDFTWERINEELAGINGYSVEEHIGKRQQDLLPEIYPKIIDTQMEVFRSGVAKRGIEVRGTTRRDPGSIRYWLVDWYPVKNEDKVIALGVCVREVTEQRHLMNELEESEGRLRRLFDAAPVFIAVTEGPTHVYTYSNPAHDAIVGRRELIGIPVAEALPELAGQGIVERFDTVYSSGKTLTIPEFKAVLDMTGSGEMEEGWFSQTIEPVRDGAGNVAGTVTFAFDITPQVSARDVVAKQNEQQRLLLGELQHRVKNTLASILAILRMTARNSDSVEEMTTTISKRLEAISRTHDLLTSTDWSSVSAADVIQAELYPFIEKGDRQISFDHEVIMLDPDMALALGLVVHELVTNSVKYGAMSQKDGQVDIVLSAQPSIEFPTLTWTESSNKITGAEPERKGFGRYLLEDAAAIQVDGEALLKFGNGELRYTLRFNTAGG
ncbi:chemotaxis protein CheB [Tateyamaria pelophila]|uniref:chemotaxis protein CheB n=1 Tax=Tateyamaria pelophila TaxID=328415 RepID=UPI001CC0F7EF|nr:chemotaxis protein CheB [Tateyamaria pelophila]